jgi:hypothetical protein
MRVLSAGQTRAPAAAAAGARAAARPVVAAADRCAALGTSRPSLAPRRPAAPARAAAAQDQAAAAVAAPVNPYDGEVRMPPIAAPSRCWPPLHLACHHLCLRKLLNH